MAVSEVSLGFIHEDCNTISEKDFFLKGLKFFDILWGGKWVHHESENHTLSAI